MDGYMENAQGHLIPVGNVKDIDKTRDSLVYELIRYWKEMHARLADFKQKMMDDIGAFVELSAEQYDVRLGGKKGNISLVSYDGKYKLILAISDLIAFDEQIHAAKQLLIECAAEWTEGSRAEVQIIINDAFQVDKAGNISVSKILALKRLNIKHPKWVKAMDAIGNSIRIDGSKAYVRAYEKNDAGQWIGLPLDIAAI